MTNGELPDRLIASLRGRRPLLLAGAGLSLPLGYPSWAGLGGLLRSEFEDQVEIPASNSTVEIAGVVKARLEEAGNLTDYYRFLQETFRPKGGPSHTDLQELLVRLPFAGIVTTNYDDGLGSAVTYAAPALTGIPELCQSLDLCDERKFPVFGFLRDLGNAEAARAVLHLHGRHTRPERLILADSDYKQAYGVLDDGLGVPLDTPHRKVLWTLLVTHTVVFAGFSLDDEAFIFMLQMVAADFDLGTARVHYALLPSEGKEDEGEKRERLRRIGVEPLFYPVEAPDVEGNQDHSALRGLVEGIATAVGVPPRGGSLDEVNERMVNL